MSGQLGNCQCACPNPEVVEIPGSPGENGAAGANGTNGVNAFTFLTAQLEIPTAGNTVIASVAVSSWMALGQVVIVSDGTEKGHFEVTALPSSTSATLEFLEYPGDSVATTIIANAAKVSPAGLMPSGTIPVNEGGTGGITAAAARDNLGVGGESLSVYAAGTAYQLTNTAALLDFGTTDPSLTITSPGVWLILARARIDYTGATFAAVRTGTLKLRRTNNTAADLTNSQTQFLTEIITTLTYTLGIIDLPPVVYTTTNSDDVIQVWGDISVVPSAGSIDASEASIVAVKLYDQTV